MACFLPILPLYEPLYDQKQGFGAMELYEQNLVKTASEIKKRQIPETYCNKSLRSGVNFVPNCQKPYESRRQRST